MRKLFVFILVIFIWARFASAAETNNPMIHRHGLSIVDGEGHRVMLRGVNLGGWLHWEGYLFGKGILTSQSTLMRQFEKIVGPADTLRFQDEIQKNFITEADIQRISESGFNVVRIPMNWRVLENPAHPYQYDQSGWDRLDQVLDWCEHYHVYAVLDLHSLPGGQSHIATADPDNTGLVWLSGENRKRAAALWRALALRYRGRRIVAGYDLMNEPNAPRGQDLIDFYRQIIASIRSVDTDHLVILEGNKLASDFTPFGQALDENEMYSFHMYTWFGDNREKLLAAYRTIAQEQRIPLWAGEFGENSYDMIKSTVSMYESAPEIAGWAYWPWKRAPTKYPGICIVNPPEAWSKMMNWVVSPFLRRKPDRDAALNAMKEFIAAVSLANVDCDARMVKILSNTHN